MEMKSVSRKKVSGAKASEGVSIIAPISSDAGRMWPSRRSRSISSRAICRATRNSSYSAMKGNITVSGRPFAARNSACNCILRTPGFSSPTRIARQPIAGFGSSTRFM